LFVEEMTKAVLEAESQSAAMRTAAVIPSSAVAVPPTLHASLMARLDRLGSAKEVAQTGAALGREFSYALLVAVMRKPEADLHSALDRIIAAGLLFRQGVPPNATYLFKHALVQDAAYSTLLRETRRALHARIAEILESDFADIAENQPEVLARLAVDPVQILDQHHYRREPSRWKKELSHDSRIEIVGEPCQTSLCRHFRQVFCLGRQANAKQGVVKRWLRDQKEDLPWLRGHRGLASV
jgi:hypothetical protein